MIYDLCIIGGGINGCGIARDAALRGLSVFLCEKNDLASATSSASSKLIHGGLRYLEHFAFRLVRESLQERERLYHIAPHLIAPLRFILPVESNLRPTWMLKAGLFLYDHLYAPFRLRTRLPRSRLIDLSLHPAGQMLRSPHQGFEYSDCWVDDARLVVLNAVAAKHAGAHIATHTEALHFHLHDNHWLITLRDHTRTYTVAAKALINAAGPWAGKIAALMPQNASTPSPAKDSPLRLVKGSHLVVKKQFSHPYAYTLQQPDGRIVFMLPFEKHFTLIGTTDVEVSTPDAPAASEAEVDYLLNACARFLKTPVSRNDIVQTFAGIRPLYNDGTPSAQKATRDYVLQLDRYNLAVALHVYGGKITTYRCLADTALNRLAPFLPAAHTPCRTAEIPLPGGDFAIDAFDNLLARLQSDYPFLKPRHAARLFKAYGTCAWTLLGDAKKPADLGLLYGATLSEREIDYLKREEFALTHDDILWRRTKLGLQIET